MKSGNLNFLEPSGPFLACNRTALPLPLHSDAHLLLQVLGEFLNGIGNFTLCPENGNTALPRSCICFILLDDGVQQIQCFIIPKPQNTQRSSLTSVHNTT